MKPKHLLRLTCFLITLYMISFLLFLIVKYPKNSKDAIEKRARIHEKLAYCNVYIDSVVGAENNKLLPGAFNSAIIAASRVEKSYLRSRNNANYAMITSRIVWLASIISPIYALILFTFISSEHSKSRNKSLAMVISFLAVLNFIDLAYDSHGRWGYSRISQYYKESLIDQWLFRMNINCQTKTGDELFNALYEETDELLRKFAEHRGEVTSSFFSLEFNQSPDPTKILPVIKK